MFEWSDTDLMVRDAVRQFIDKEIRPHQDALETGELSPYPIARKLFSQFGLDVLLAESVNQMLDGERAKREKRDSSGSFGLADQASMVAVLVSELARRRGDQHGARRPVGLACHLRGHLFALIHWRGPLAPAVTQLTAGRARCSKVHRARTGRRRRRGRRRIGGCQLLRVEWSVVVSGVR
ncbi:acyl-CoA dehydrogenase [Mycobacterium tuberculosis]|nr:acyl-CoA dehydrogenase [Mycobacterium tuberculosis]